MRGRGGMQRDREDMTVEVMRECSLGGLRFM